MLGALVLAVGVTLLVAGRMVDVAGAPDPVVSAREAAPPDAGALAQDVTVYIAPNEQLIGG